MDGAYLLTNSKIKFGTENTVTPQNYHTTTRSNFSAKYEPVERRDWQTTYSNVCLDYYGMFPIRIHQLSFTFKFQEQKVVMERMYTKNVISFLYVCMVNTIYLFSFVETPRKFIIAELSIRKLGSSSVLLALMKIQAYGSKALQ